MSLMATDRPVPADLAFLTDPAARYARIGPSFVPDLSWTSLDDLSAADLQLLTDVFLKINQPDTVNALFEWLHETEGGVDAVDSNSVRTQIVNLTGVFEILARKRLKPFKKLRDPLKGQRASRVPTEFPDTLSFLADLSNRFGDVIQRRGESGAQAVFRKLGAKTKQDLTAAAARIREQQLYRRVILPYLASGSTQSHARLYGFCGFLDINGFDIE